MFDVMTFKFPNFTEDSLPEIERKYCQLLNEYRSGKKLDPEVIDWMDSANNFLLTSGASYGR